MLPLRLLVLIHSVGIGAHQIPISQEADSFADPPKIAVIGAGIAGASVAHTLLGESDSKYHVTLFEKESHVGGRIQDFNHTAPWAKQPLEQGAEWFSATDDTCLLNIADSINANSQQGRGAYSNVHLNPQPPLEATCDADTNEWSRLTKTVWQYGRIALKVRGYVKAVRSGWARFLSDDAQDDDLGMAMDRAGFRNDLFLPMDLWLRDLTSDRAYERGILQPCAMARLYTDPRSATALSTLLATRALAPTSIPGGNALLVKHRLESIKPELLLNSTVRDIDVGLKRKFRLSYDSPAKAGKEYAEFDIVVLAIPLIPSGIQINIPGVKNAAVEYEERHVTHFTSPLPIFANASDSLALVSPGGVRTSLSTKDNLIAVTSAWQIWKPCLPGWPECDQFKQEVLYRLTSHHPPSHADLVGLLDHHYFDTRPGLPRLPKPDMGRDGITWVHRCVWPDAVPMLDERDTTLPRTAEIAPGLFYTSALERMSDSMELSCRMGRHVGQSVKRRLLV